MVRLFLSPGYIGVVNSLILYRSIRARREVESLSHVPSIPMPNPPIENVDYALIVGTMQSLIDAIDRFLDEAQLVMNSRAGLPSAHAPMMADVANEKTFVHSEWMQEPIESVAMAATLSCFAAQESLSSMVRLVVTGPPPPIFSADVLCRSAIDSSRPAWWLTEAHLTTEKRIQRVVAESLYSAIEMSKVTSERDTQARGVDVRHRLGKYAQANSWVVGKDTNVVAVGSQTRPTVRRFLEAEFGDPDAAHSTWSYLSAITHGTQYGLIQAIDVGSIDGGMAILGTSTTKLSSRMEIAATVVMSATMRFLDYMGWTTDAVRHAASRLTAELRARAISRQEDP